MTFHAEAGAAEGFDDTRQVRIRGRVTYDEAPRLRTIVLDEVERGSARRLILDLRGVEAMDTSGAAVLAEVLRVGENKGMRVLLCSPSESVIRIFLLAGFEDIVDRCCAGWEETRRRLAG
jgi:anti-anti-sigma factor